MADNTYRDEYISLATLFNAGWGSKIPVQYENIPFTPVVGTAWARFTLAGGSAEYASVGSPGNNAIRHTGVIQIQCFAPLGGGGMSAREMADKALNIFMNAIEPGYHFRAGYAVVAGNTDSWYQVNAVIPYWRDSYEYAVPE